jgi:hypothetical protein
MLPKIDSWPQAIVLVTGIVAAGAVFAFLVAAGWKEGSIAAMVTLVVGQFIGLYVTTRKASTVEAKTDQQSAQLDVIQKQTNGRSAAELAEVAERAAEYVLGRQRFEDKP